MGRLMQLRDRAAGPRLPAGAWALAAALAVLLPAGAFAAAAAEPRPAGPGAGIAGRVSAAGVVQEAVPTGEPAAPATPPAGVTTTLPPPPVVDPPPVPTTRAPRSTTSTSRPAPTPTTLLPLPPIGPAPTTTAPPPANPWSRTVNGVSVRLRMDPPAPVAGQPVTFTVEEVTAPLACCIVHLSFGDGTDRSLFGSTGTTVCDPPATTRSGLKASHTYATPGTYEILLVVLTVPCTVDVVDGQPVPAPITGTDIRACIAVGPGTPTPARCSPFAHFDPQSGRSPG
jgi:hypothetical protein